MANEIPKKDLIGIRWKMVKPSEQILSQKEAIDFLQISEYQLIKLRKKKEIPAYLEKGCYFYSKADCVDWINKNQPDRFKKVEPKRTLRDYLKRIFH